MKVHKLRFKFFEVQWMSVHTGAKGTPKNVHSARVSVLSGLSEKMFRH